MFRARHYFIHEGRTLEGRAKLVLVIILRSNVHVLRGFLSLSGFACARLHVLVTRSYVLHARF